MCYSTVSRMEVTTYNRRGEVAYTLLYDPRFRIIHTIRSVLTRGASAGFAEKLRIIKVPQGP